MEIEFPAHQYMIRTLWTNYPDGFSMPILAMVVIKAGATTRTNVEGQTIKHDNHTKIHDILSSQEYSEVIKSSGYPCARYNSYYSGWYKDGVERNLTAVLSNQLQSTKEHSSNLREVDQTSKQLD
ncbi:hypothetical protein [Candidatus Enterovibrio escicola]|uniref:hypothetical protein n=2 Tax=Candidatus Enterovibrio escicola TaxID=1927127 RepID=UPI001237C1E5|nr:hypothetical protein [Candidatus Enterovibrio escacola]